MPVNVQEAFAAWRTKHARRAWKPVCVEGRADGARFGGSPSLAADERWPMCQSCRVPMQFFLELPSTSLPAGYPRRGEGTLQLFYCSRDDGSCETWRPFSGSHLVRLLRGATELVNHPLGLAPLPSRLIERWSEVLDYPHPEEHGELGLVYDYDFAKKRVSVASKDFGVALRDLDIEMDVAETIAKAEAGDKLGGWPLWIQNVDYPSCTQCGRRMELVFQIDSEDNIPHMFGDVGCGHITQCPDHPELLAFGWACS